MSSHITTAATRVPKLAVRNRSTDANDNVPTALSSHPATTRGRGTSDPSRPASQGGSMATSTTVSRRDSTQSKQSQQQPTNPKKKNGVLGFLTLKEPSTNALEQFAEQQRKAAAAAKTARPTAASISSVSVQKLPDHVPKVNSKWDGLPEDARKKMEHQRRISHETGTSLFTTTTRRSRGSSNSSGSSGATRRPIGSISSRPISMTSTIRGAKYTVIHPHIAYDTNAAIAVHPDPYGEPSPLQADSPGVLRRDFSRTMSPISPLAFSPVSSEGSHAHAVHLMSGAIPAELAGMSIAELPGDGPVELPAGEPPQMAGDEPAYITSPGGSPLTPPTDGMPGQIPRVMNRGMIMDEYGTMWYSDTDPEESDGHVTDSEVQYNDLSNELPKAFGKRRPLEYIAESPIEYMAESPMEYPETPDDWPLSRRAARAVQASDSTGMHTPTDITTTPSSISPPPAGPLPPVPATSSTTTTNIPSRPLMAPTSIYSQYSNANLAARRPNSIAPSIAPSVAPSLAPSVGSSIDWPLPPTSRLAMGGNTGPTPRKADVAPWERFDDRVGGPAATFERSSSAVKASLNSAAAGPAAGPKKRFTGILGRR
jgi:hypothetical protein